MFGLWYSEILMLFVWYCCGVSVECLVEFVYGWEDVVVILWVEMVWLCKSLFVVFVFELCLY